jgi:hypothetical protein
MENMMRRSLIGIFAESLLALMALTSGCATAPPSSTAQQTITTAGTNAVSLAWIGYGAASDGVQIYAADGRMTQATADKISADFKAAYDLIESLQAIVTSTATTQPTLDTINQDAIAIATAILQISTDLNGSPSTAGNPPVVLNIPAPPSGMKR